MSVAILVVAILRRPLIQSANKLIGNTNKLIKLKIEINYT